MPQRQEARQEPAPLNTLVNNPYGFSSLNYPSDIENLSHAILFNVMIQDSTKDLSANKSQLAQGTNGQPVGSRTAELTKGNLLGLTRRTKRSKTAISLYVPETVVFDDKQSYQQMNLLDTLGIAGTTAATGSSSLAGASGGMGAGGAVAATLGASAAVAAGDLLGSAARRVLDRGGVAGSILNAATSVSSLKTAANIVGFAINPVIEVLYQNPQLRSFNFDFVFAPRSSKEADDVWSIIYQFRRHSAPELLAKGTMFIPPSEFEITFLRKTGTGFAENTNIPRISTCVLETVQTDYASVGNFTTFTDGMPIQIRMRLSFKELNIITREAIDRGY